MHASIKKCVIGLMFSMAAMLAADEDYRVVLQDVRPEFLAVSRDGRIVAARGYESNHTFQVIDIQKPAVLLVVDLPERVSHAAIAPQNGSFIVSGEETIFRVDRITGKYEVLLHDTSGVVALNNAGDQLGVLGSFRRDEDDDKPFAFSHTSNLGIYDLNENKWRAKAKTPIAAGQFVYFDGKSVVGYGIGGRIHNRVASSFRCDVRLNVLTSKATVTRGLELRGRGRGHDERDDEYTPPKQIEGITEARNSAIKRLDEIRDQFNPSVANTASSRIFHPLPGSEIASMLVDRRFDIGFASGLLNIHRDGTIDVTPASIDGIQYVRLLDGRLVEGYGASHSGEIFDLLTKEPVIQFPPFDNKSGRQRLHKFFPTGCLLYEDGHLSWYRTTKPDAIWKIKLSQPLQNLYPVFVSPDSRWLAINHPRGDNVFDVYSLETGKPVVSIPRTKGIPTGYSLSPNFNHDGTRLAATIEKRLQLFEIPSGKRLRDEPLPNDKYHWHITSVGKHWVVGSDTDSSIFHAETGWGPRIPLSSIYRATKVRCQGRESLLVETRRGLGAIVNLQTGELNAKWYVGAYQGTLGPPQTPDRAFTTFDGKLLIRQVAHAAEVELIDLATLTPIAKVHPVPVERKLGWIISTDDGYWDASPGAERHLVMYDGLRRLTTDEAEGRKKAAEIQKRIARLSGISG